MCTREAFGIDRILLGTDFPYEDQEECIDFIEKLPIRETEKEKVYYKNALQLGISI
jgi:predicted TIM-barrel fold metal-dependent hydrolase